mmetsp:Transcript_3038/g.6924  ORF Transcript_3038/g.6924 Transcript_3038/m.6924 type:complete len:338 (-) Transcript_3038:1712-2725(-)
MLKKPFEATATGTARLWFGPRLASQRQGLVGNVRTATRRASLEPLRSRSGDRSVTETAPPREEARAWVTIDARSNARVPPPVVGTEGPDEARGASMVATGMGTLQIFTWGCAPTEGSSPARLLLKSAGKATGNDPPTSSLMPRRGAPPLASAKGGPPRCNRWPGAKKSSVCNLPPATLAALGADPKAGAVAATGAVAAALPLTVSQRSEPVSLTRKRPRIEGGALRAAARATALSRTGSVTFTSSRDAAPTATLTQARAARSSFVAVEEVEGAPSRAAKAPRAVQDRCPRPDGPGGALPSALAPDTAFALWLEWRRTEARAARKVLESDRLLAKAAS